MKLLIVKLSAFGDIIHALPALDDLLAREEVREAHWLVDSRYRFVTEILPPQVKVHAIPFKQGRSFTGILQGIAALRREHFDVVLDLQWLIKSALLGRLAGSSVYGADRGFYREKAAALLTRNVPFHPEERHVVQQYRRVAAAPFAENPRLSPDTPMPYAPPMIRRDIADRLRDPARLESLGLQAQGYVVLHSAGGWQTKQLPAETWQAVARGIGRTGLQAVFSWGSAEEKAVAATLAEASGALLLPERLNMSALTTLLGQAKAVIGADTGVLHLAAALDTPTITFWGPSASWRSGPIGEKHWHVESNPACGPCFKRTCDHFICMEQIRASAILEALNERP